MDIKAPIKFDDNTIFKVDGIALEWGKKSGYDANGRRVTNLTGHTGKNFKKYCPRCKLSKIDLEFGYDGRYIDGESQRRDQSYCIDYRGLHQ